MKIYYELDLESFEAWQGAIPTLERIINEGKVDELEALLKEFYPYGMDETQLNDILWFESDWLFEQLDIPTYEQLTKKIDELEQELEQVMEEYRQEAEELETTEEKDKLFEMYQIDIDDLKEQIEELKEQINNI